VDQPNDPIRLDAALTEWLQDYAAARGIDLQEAFETAQALASVWSCARRNQLGSRTG